MSRYRKALCAAVILLAAGLAMLVGTETKAHRSPLSIGATADEAWTYIHTPAAWVSHGLLFDTARNGWIAHARDIQCDASYSLRWPKDRLFATRHIVYLLDTNGTIVGIKSHWKWVRPF
ncbi:MAG: hypothetical protein DME25_02220 [Verrucomicrobia bacterium]|nr:MAG: hypothetical protein DME25_02220 [Verrucomicrobiota bacterium]